MDGHKLLGANDTRIRKIVGAVSEPIAFTKFKFSVTLLFKQLVLDDLDVSFLGSV